MVVANGKPAKVIGAIMDISSTQEGTQIRVAIGLDGPGTGEAG